MEKEGHGDGCEMGVRRLGWRRRVPPACRHGARARGDGRGVDGGGGGGGGGCKALDASSVIGPNEEASGMGRGGVDSLEDCQDCAEALAENRGKGGGGENV